MRIKSISGLDEKYLTKELEDEVNNSISAKSFLPGILLITVLMAFGIGILYFKKIFFIKSLEELWNIFISGGMEIIVSLLFIVVGIFAWIYCIRNALVKPKVDTLYLLEKDQSSSDDHTDVTCTFVDRKGKKYYYYDKEYEIGACYKVIKSYDSVLAVIEKSNEVFGEIKVKASYWMNYYSPMGNYEEIFILPIVYAILLIGFLVFVGSLIGFKGASFIILFPFRLFCSLFFVLPLGLIIYDFIYKYKLKKGLVDKNDEDDLENRFNIFMMMQITIGNIFRIIFLIIFNGILWFFLVNAQDNEARLMIVPFVIIAGIMLIKEIFSILKR